MNKSPTTITKITSSQQTTSLPQAVPATKSTPSTQSTPISICIITKNECDTLRQCLTCLKPYADAGKHEIVLVDTGSTDNTVEICKEFTDKIYYFEWINDFSAARNANLSVANGSWYLYLDDDEWFEDTSEIEQFFLSGEYRDNCRRPETAVVEKAVAVGDEAVDKRDGEQHCAGNPA